MRRAHPCDDGAYTFLNHINHTEHIRADAGPRYNVRKYDLKKKRARMRAM
jgi:hypothetical protein